MPVHPGARFSDPAELYDLVYAWRDYPSHAVRVRELLHAEGIADGARVLEGACGTGLYLGPLAEHFSVLGFDLDPKMLAIAKRRLPPRTPLFVADLADFSLPEGEAPVDAAVVLFGGVGYVYRHDRLAACARALHAAIRPGGVALIEPWNTPSEFEANRPFMHVVDLPFLKVARQCVTRVEDGVSVLEFHWLIARPGFPVEHKVECNRLFLYETHEVVATFAAAGFAVEVSDQGFMPEKRLLTCRR